MKRLFLDDFRVPKDAYNLWHRPEYYNNDDWDIVKSYDEFIAYIESNGIPDVISFDHDLGLEHYQYQSDIDYTKFKEKTGYDCAKWLINHCIENNAKLPKYYCHSQNPVGTQNIINILTDFMIIQQNKELS